MTLIKYRSLNKEREGKEKRKDRRKKGVRGEKENLKYLFNPCYSNVGARTAP